MPAPKPNAVARQPEVLVHGERGEADIHPVEIGDEIADDQERNEPRRHLPDSPSLQVLHSRSFVLGRLSITNSIWFLAFPPPAVIGYPRRFASRRPVSVSVRRLVAVLAA